MSKTHAGASCQLNLRVEAVGGSGKRSPRSLPMADRQTIGKLRLPLPPVGPEQDKGGAHE